MNNLALICAQTITLPESGTLEELLTVAFKKAKGFWLTTDDNVRLQGGIIAVGNHLGMDHPDFERLSKEMKVLGALSAATSGVPVDFAALGEPDPNPIGVLALYRNA